MDPHFNKLTPGEHERLALVMEECGEVIHIIGKIMRHGYASHHPLGGPSNRELLEKEIGDLQLTTKLLNDIGDVSPRRIKVHMKRKAELLPPYLHHN